MKESSQGKKILVALSGGVDSAVAAAILKKRGHEVVGIFFDLGNWGERGLENAKRIAKKLDIPLKIIDARKEFKKKIIDYFVSSYKKGLTPNPCVACNKEIKFRLLFDLMKKHKADYVATGHYARLRHELKVQSSKFKAKEKFIYKLLQARDDAKDQSYFLYNLAQKELSKIIFPLGDCKKTEVKKIAEKLRLPIVSEESQDICFLQGKDINSFLKKYIKMWPGNIVDESGKMLGKHKGLPLYTLGQRKGIEIGGTGPYFVIGKNSRKNELVVTNDSKKMLARRFLVDKVNWASKDVKFPLRAKVQVRYHAEKFPAIIKKARGGRWEVKNGKPLRAVTPGQSAVFYGDKKEVLGGGIIM